MAFAERCFVLETSFFESTGEKSKSIKLPWTLKSAAKCGKKVQNP